MPVSKAVKLANKASAERLASLISKGYELPSTQVFYGNALQTAQREAIWAVFEANMYELYKESSFGWDPKKKKKELFHPLSRFILLYEDDTKTLIAFTMFRFEFEDEEDITYCYELQVSEIYQRLGLGCKMLNELAKLCDEFQMEKIMLTVLKSNERAMAFYETLGFVLDPASPDHEGNNLEVAIVGDVDYKILSKNIL